MKKSQFNGKKVYWVCYAIAVVVLMIIGFALIDAAHDNSSGAYASVVFFSAILSFLFAYLGYFPIKLLAMVCAIHEDIKAIREKFCGE